MDLEQLELEVYLLKIQVKRLMDAVNPPPLAKDTDEQDAAQLGLF